MSETRINWYRTKIDKETLRELTQKSDAWGLAQSLGHLALSVATGYITWHVCVERIWWAIIPAFFLHGTVTSFMGVGAACHELSHGTVFKTKWLNDFFYGLFSFISWSNPVWFRTSHMKHHQYTLHQPDDLEVILPAHFGLKDFLNSLQIGFEHVRYPIRKHFRYSLGRVKGEWDERIFPPEKPELRRALFNWSRFILIGHIALAAGFIAIGQWILIPIALIPFYSNWLNLLVAVPQHLGLQAEVDDFRMSCRTVLLHPINAFLYWQMNYHLEHHMYAAVPFFRLKKLHELIKHDCPEPNQGLADTWREIIMIQSFQDKNKSVAYDQWSRGKEPQFIAADGRMEDPEQTPSSRISPTEIPVARAQA